MKFSKGYKIKYMRTKIKQIPTLTIVEKENIISG